MLNQSLIVPSEESMSVKVVGSYLYIPPEVQVDKSMLYGWTQRKNDPVIVAEDNLVNRIILSLPFYTNGCECYDPTNEALEEYQVKDVRKGLRLGNHLNLNRMGFGKTVETIEMLRLRGFNDIVIVAPKPVCYQWADQISVWWPERANDVGVFDLKKPITIMNYEKLLQTPVISKLRSKRHDAVVLDEVHFIKTRDSKRTIASKLIPANVHIGLSGTPILRQPDDLWSLLNFVDPRYSGKSYWGFVKYFCNVEEGPFGRTINGVTKNPARLALLKKVLELVTIRNEVVVAQGKRRVEVMLDMDEKQRDFYTKVKKLVLDELPPECTISNGAVLAMRLQQATSNPGLFVEKCPGVKFEWIKTFCKGTDEQVVVMTKFEKTASALATYLRKEHIKCALYTGKQKATEQNTSKKAFIDKKAQVIIGTISAMGTGVDGLQVAHLGIMMERSWSPEINEQCEDRLNRRGQDAPVMWYYLNCTKSFDQHVDKVNLNKADSIRAVLEVDE